MKRFFCVFICFILLLLCLPASAADLSLPVKMKRQMQHDGNGIKGNIIIHANADAETLPFLHAVQNSEFSLLRNASGEKWHLRLFQNDENGNQINQTEFCYDKDLFVRSDFLPGKVYTISDIGFFLPESLFGQNENIPFISVISSFLFMNDSDHQKWDPVISKYSKALEIWISNYAADPEITRNSDGTVQMNLIYNVPADEMCKEILQLIRSASADPEILSILGIVMTEEQQSIYLNPFLDFYYEQALQGMSLNEDIRFVKTVSAMGELISYELILPLNPDLSGYSSLTISGDEKHTVYTLKNENKLLMVSLPQDYYGLFTEAEYQTSAGYTYCDLTGEQSENNISIEINILKTSEKHMDDETGKEHEIHHYQITVDRNTALLPEGISEQFFPEFNAVHIGADYHYSGKSGPNAPTSLEINIDFSRNDLNMTLYAKIKTASTWPFEPFGTDNAVPLSRLGDTFTDSAVAEWVRNASNSIIRIQESDHVSEGGSVE